MNDIQLTCPVCKKKSYTRTGTVSHLFNQTKRELMEQYILNEKGYRGHIHYMRMHAARNKSLTLRK